jgi:integrase
VSAWHSAMDPGNPTQRAHAYALLRCILGQAKEEGLLAGDNPCRIRGAGVFRREREIEPLSIPQLEVIGRPKSDAGVRKVAVPPHVVPALRAHLDSHVAQSLTRCSSRPSPARTGRTGTSTRLPGSGTDGGRRPHPPLHDLRHTSAVLAAQKGATLGELMARLGHSTSVAALRYQHAAEGRDAAIAEALSGLAADQLAQVISLRS